MGMAALQRGVPPRLFFVVSVAGKGLRAVGFRKCGKQRTYGRVFLDVRQLKDLGEI